MAQQYDGKADSKLLFEEARGGGGAKGGGAAAAVERQLAEAFTSQKF